MALKFSQCLLFVAHKDSIPEALSPDRLPPPRVQRPQIAVYALIPHNERFLHIRQIFAHFGVTVLADDAHLDPLLIEAIINDRVEVVELFYDKRTIEIPLQLVIYADRFNSDIVNAVFTGNRIKSSVSSELLFRICSNDTDFDILLDEENLSILERLTSIRADIRYRNEDGGTFLHFAIRRNYSSLFELLLKKGAEVGSRNLCGLTALHVAAQFNASAAILDLLIRNGGDINVAVKGSSWDGVTPLHIALRSCRLNVAEYLLNNGASVDVDSCWGNILHLAIETDDPLILACVLRHRPDINDGRNQTAFRSAVKSVKKEAVTMLAEFGFRLAPADAKNTRMLRGALASSQLIGDLLKWGVTVYGKDVESLVIEVLENGHEDSIRLFLELGDSFSDEFLVALFRKAVFLNNTTFTTDILDSRLSLDLILNSFLSDKESLGPALNADYSGSLNNLPEGNLRQRICEYISVVKTLDLNVNNCIIKRVLHSRRQELPGWFMEVVRAANSEEFKLQVAILKNERVGTSTFSFHDFLNASLSQIVSFFRNCSVVDDLQTQAYGDKFLSYMPMIKWRFYKANVRRALLNKGVNMFNFLFRQSALVALPCELKEKIVNYLCNIDLLVLVNVCELPSATSGNGDSDH